jgi:orotate phosphoribosyltransferase
MNNPNQTKYKSETAELLLKLKAIKLQPNDPFTWASGWKSPIYCDNRIILSNIGCRNKIANYFSQLITEKYKDVDVIAGRQNQIEGEVSKGKKIIVIEDLISTGKSSLNAVKALREAELDVLGMVAIFTYDFEISKNNFLKDSVKLNTLSNYSELLKKAVEINYVSEKDIETLEKWNKSPESWS